MCKPTTRTQQNCFGMETETWNTSGAASTDEPWPEIVGEVSHQQSGRECNGLITSLTFSRECLGA
jgi:hypothetical protein